MGERPHIERRRLARLAAPVLGIVAALVLGATLATVVLSLPGIAHSASKNCEVSLEVRDALRDLLVRAQALSAQNPAATPEQQKVAADFYRVSIERVDGIRC